MNETSSLPGPDETCLPPVHATDNHPPADSIPLAQETALPKAAPSSTIEAAYHAALERMIEMARCAGAAEERARIHEIMIAEGAHRFPRLAWNLAKTGAVSREQAVSVFAAAETDVAAMVWQSPTRH
jgi:hypothetical protein